jgi:hypothetical protein
MKLFLMIGVVAPLFCGWSNGLEGAPLYGNEYGVHFYGRETVESITMNGSAVLEGTTVIGNTSVNGNLRVNEATLNTLIVIGKVALNGSLVDGEVVINGLLTADKTKFNKGISIASETVVFKNCQIASINVRESRNRVQIVELRDGTQVEGSIVFESGKGEVWLYPGSVVKGDVVGAQIKKNR